MELGSLSHFLVRTDGDLIKKTVRGSFWISSSFGFEKILQLGRIVVLARLLAPSDFGLLGICTVVLGGIEIFTQTGIDTALIQKKDNIDKYLNTAWTIALVRGLILFALIYFSAPLFANFFKDQRLVALLRAIGLVFIFSGLGNIATVYFQKEMHFLKDGILTQLPNILSFIIAIGLAFYLRDVWALVISQIVGRAFSMVFSYYLHPYRPQLELKMEHLKEMIHFGKYIFATGIVVYLITQGDNAVVGKMLGPAALGFYALAYNLANMPTLVISHLTSKLLFPVYSNHQSDKNRIIKIFSSAIQGICYLSFPLCLGMLVLAEEVVTFIYGVRWLPMVPAFRILCFYCLLRSVISHPGTLFVGLGRPNLGFYVSLINLILMAVLILPFTRMSGYTGTAMAVTLPFIVLFIVVYYITGKVLNTGSSFLLKKMIPPILYSCMMAAATFFLKRLSPFSDQWIHLPILIVAGFLCYVILLFLFKKKYIINLKQTFSESFGNPGLEKLS